MQLGDALCYALLTVTMAATCIQAEIEFHEGQERRLDKKKNRRVATLFIEGTPIENILQNPSKVHYRRLTRKRHAPAKPAYGPMRPNYEPHVRIPVRKPEKKHRGKTNKHAPSRHAIRAPKPRYGPPKRKPTPRYGPPKRKPKPTYGPPIIRNLQPYNADNSGFAEPPISFPKKHWMTNSNVYFQDNLDNEPPSQDYNNYISDFTLKPHIEQELSSPASFSYYFQDKPYGDSLSHETHSNDYQNHKNENVKVPVDSYGAPIKPNLHDLTFATAQSAPEPTSLIHDNYSFESDPVSKYIKKHPRFSQHEEVFVTPLPEDQAKELDLNSYSDIYNFREMKNKKKNRASSYDNIKIVNRPWINKMKENDNDDIIVGGQYAEPPARYVAKFQPSAPMQIREEFDSVFSPVRLSDPDGVPATISSYVNYKNSNMAFSPQNLNDAFSIVDK